MSKIDTKNWNIPWWSDKDPLFVPIWDSDIETIYSPWKVRSIKYKVNPLNTYFTDIYLKFLAKIKCDLFPFSYLLFGLGLLIDLLIFTNRLLSIKVKNIYCLLYNIIIVICWWFFVKIYFNHAFAEISSFHMSSIVYAFEEQNTLKGIYHILAWLWTIDKYIIILALFLIVSYIAICIFNILDILFWYNFKFIKYTKDNYHIYIGQKLFNIKPIEESHNQFIEKNLKKILIYWWAIWLFFYSLISFPFLVYIESLRIFFWMSIWFLLLFIVIYIFFLFIYYLVKNPTIFSYHRLIRELDKFALLDEEFKYHIQQFKQGYIEESFWESLWDTFTQADKIKKILKNNPKLDSYSRHDDFHTSIQDIIDYNIDQYMLLFDEILNFIDEAQSDICLPSFQEKAEMYKNKIWDMKEKFQEIQSL